MKRDPRMIALSIVAPILITALFGTAFGGDLTHIKVYVVIDDENFKGIFSNEILDQMDENQIIQLNYTAIDPTSAIQSVNKNYTQAAIIFPNFFTQNLLLGIGEDINLYVSYANLNASNYLIGVFQSSFDNVMKSYFGNPQVKIIITPIHPEELKPLPNLINVSIYNPDLGWAAINHKLSKDVCDILDDDDTVDIVKVKSVKAYKDSVKKGEVRAIIQFPEEFTYDALIKKQIKIKAILDGAEPQASMAILGALQSALSDVFEDTFDKSAFEIKEYYYNNIDGTDDSVENITYFTPAILGFIVFFFSFLLTMLAFIRERKEGTMERILTSPLKNSEIILGYILSASILALTQGTVVIIATIMIFNAQIEFTLLNLLQIYLIIYILVLIALGMGIFLSTLAKTEFQIIQFIPLVILPFMLLSGVWAPVETLPEWLRPLSQFVPLTWSNIAMRDILLRGETIVDVILPLSILVAFAIIMIFLGILKLNKTLK